MQKASYTYENGLASFVNIAVQLFTSHADISMAEFGHKFARWEELLPPTRSNTAENPLGMS